MSRKLSMFCALVQPNAIDLVVTGNVLLFLCMELNKSVLIACDECMKW